LGLTGKGVKIGIFDSGVSKRVAENFLRNFIVARDLTGGNNPSDCIPIS